MDGGILEELRALRRSQSLRLMEATELTRQIADAAERGDSVAAELLAEEREGPVRAAHALSEELRRRVQEQPEEDARRLDALLHGAPARSEEEAGLAEQTAQFTRLLGAIVEMDRRLSERLGGERSFYRRFMP